MLPWKLWLLIFIVGMGIGFISGYGVRAFRSYRRRLRAERNRLVYTYSNNAPGALR